MIRPTPRGLGGLSSSPPAPSLADLVQRMERARPARPQREVVLIVHGTYANPGFGESWTAGSEIPWWKSYGSLAKVLDAALERHGSPARCGADLDELLTSRRGFERHTYWDGWSGANSEVERRQGAYALAEDLRALQADDGVSTFHIVAHSHGGNLARRALRYLRAPSHKRGAVVCLGTPFLHFADRAAWRRWVARVHWPMLLVLALVGWAFAALARKPEPDQLQLYAVGAVGAAALLSAWRFARATEVNSTDPPAVAVRFARDEAIQLLRSCAEMTAEPHVFLRDVLGGAAPERPWRHRRGHRPSGWIERLTAAAGAVGRGLANVFIALSNLWNGPVRRAAEAATSLAYRVPLLGSLCTLLLLLAFRPYRPPLRPFLSSRMPRLKPLFFHSVAEESERMIAEQPATTPVPPYRGFGAWPPEVAGARDREPWWKSLSEPLRGTPFDPDTAKAVAAFVAAALYLVFLPIDKLLGLPAWLGKVGTRFAILTGARAAAGGAAGMDMLGAAFRPRRTATVPDEVEEVTVPAAIEDAVEERLEAVERVDFRALRAGLDPARRATLAKAIEAAFTDVGLLHAQYYQDPRIIDYVAQRIAGRETPEWRLELPSETSSSDHPNLSED